MIVKTPEVEIRGYEIKTSAKTGNKYIIVRIDDPQGKRVEIIDRNLANESQYVRGKMAYLYLDLELGRYTNVSIDHLEESK